ncbi:site-specific DNA-methyltransferase (adenine-specific) [Xanthomonas arboricola]|uniref:DNA-methyltransferase n=1 Tax=Xanthomonas arboricola TaxID=56448 RepID=UPI00160C93D0|nr:DNA methyltransferase [Xanthomonas arboricola]MBB4604173.1 site-specific DNA-methyltransferase (adenine-specific) [Xanthomonas arboricola]
MTRSAQIYVGDSLSILPTLADASVDSIVTDPPDGLSFLGKRWDYDVPSTAIWAECLRVLKPGGHLLAFAGTRTQHRMAVRIEDAGFEIRDMIAWVYGSGFPKSHNGAWGGTALKPALEPITMARKPLVGTVAANVAMHGTGGLNIDGCRIETLEHLGGGAYAVNGGRSVSQSLSPTGMNRPGATAGEFLQPAGRWPANLIHDGSAEVLAAFPDAPGQMADASTQSDQRKTQNVYGSMRRGRGDEASADSENAGAVGFKMRPGARRADSGSAARFFYCAKASRADRNDGLYLGHTAAVHAEATMRDCQSADWAARNGNHHPTVKPTDLMRYLCRLVTPAGGTVLDPFMGSGSTGKAAVLEGFAFVGIEMDPTYAAIAEARIAAAVEAAAREAALPTQIGLPLGDVA